MTRQDKQGQILDYIKEKIKEKGYPPSVREICDAVGLNLPLRFMDICKG